MPITRMFRLLRLEEQPCLKRRDSLKITTILDYIDNGHIALPEFQRGFVWNRTQVKELVDSLYHGHPVGSLLVWTTDSKGVDFRGEGQIAKGVVKLLLDGQQRITALYGIIRGNPPQFFDGNREAFTGLHFNLKTEEFSFYMATKMKDDPLWVDVTKLMKGGTSLIGEYVALLSISVTKDELPLYIGRLSKILAICEKTFYIEEVTGADKRIDTVVDIFNRVNSGGTKLSKGDLTLAHICAALPDAREMMKLKLKEWEKKGFKFTLDWFLRVINAIVTGEAHFFHLQDVEPSQITDGINRAAKSADYILNMIGDRLGLDHERVLFSKNAIPIMANYIDRRGGKLTDSTERDRLLYWYIQSAMWGRFSGSTESMIDKDLEIIDTNGGTEGLVSELALWHGGLRVQPGHFSGWSTGARFYPILYMLTRVGTARDLATGMALKSSMLGKFSHLEVHHIFPQNVLYKKNYKRPEVNAVANFCFLTKESNIEIRDREPEKYFPEMEKRNPGVLASQWIPAEERLWKVGNFREFLECRKQLLSNAANAFLDELSKGLSIGQTDAPIRDTVEVSERISDIPGTIMSADEEKQLIDLRFWLIDKDLPEGVLSFELINPDSGELSAILDLAWPEGIQTGLSEPVAVLLNEEIRTFEAANRFGYRCFSDVQSFKEYVAKDILAQNGER